MVTGYLGSPTERPGGTVVSLGNRQALSSRVCVCVCVCVQSCPTLCDPMDCSLAGSCVHGTSQARGLEWAALSFSRGSSQPGISRTGRQIGHHCATWEASTRHCVCLFVSPYQLKERTLAFAGGRLPSF